MTLERQAVPGHHYCSTEPVRSGKGALLHRIKQYFGGIPK